MDGVAEQVRHRDPALHGGDRGEHEDAGAVARGVDAACRGARDPVDLDEAAVVEGTPTSSRPMSAVFGMEPSASRQCEP